jgi:transposase
MTRVADVVDAVAGVDSHADTLAVAIAAAPSGVILARGEFPATGAGIDQLIGFALESAPGPELVFAIEGTRCYGIGLARAVARLGAPVIEVERPARARRRGRGKTDAIDAELAARTALGLDAAKLPTPRCDGDREALRILLVARDEMTWEKTAKTNRLIALLRTGSDADADLVRGKLTLAALDQITRRRGRAEESEQDTVRRVEARRLATAILDLQRQLRANLTDLARIGDRIAPGLTQRVRAGQRRPRDRGLVPPRPVPQRGRVREPRRRRPHPRVQRKDGTAPAEPRRGPATQPRPARHRHHSDALLPPHPRLRAAAQRRTADSPGDPPLPQALHRRRTVPRPQHRREEQRRNPIPITPTRHAVGRHAPPPRAP